MPAFSVNLRLFPYPNRSLSDRLPAIREALDAYFDLAGQATSPASRQLQFTVSELPGPQETEPSGGLADDTLDQHWRALPQPPGGPAWTVDLLVAGRSRRSGFTYGVMFDLSSRRAGAVFRRAIDKYNPSSHRDVLLTRTIAHEIGHALNLCHAPIEADLMRAGRPRQSELEVRELSSEARNHLANHPLSSVRPGESGYGTCVRQHEHPPGASCSVEDTLSGGRSRSVELGLKVHPGVVYPETVEPTLVIGEPLNVTLELVNGSSRAVRYPANSSSVHQRVVFYRVEESGAVPLHPPLRFCDCEPDSSWKRVGPGERVTFHESILFRNEELVFPREGCFGVAARLWIRNRWLTSAIQTVHVAPPLKSRHESSCRLAREPEAGLFLELGGGEHLHKGYEVLRRLQRDNPDFPLNDLTRLVLGRRAALEGRTPYPSWRASIRRIRENPRQPAFVRREADLLLDFAERSGARGARDDVGASVLEQVIPLASARRIRRHQSVAV